METRARALAHLLRFGWPAVMGALTFATMALQSPTQSQFRETHGFYEVALIWSLMAAAGYTIRLRPSQHGGKRSLAWMINGLYVCGGVLIIVIGLMSMLL
jgi:hypothetical protein